MEEKVNVLGISGAKTIQSWKEKFNSYYEDTESALFVSKEEFIHEGDDGIKDFKYRYAVVCDLLGDDDNPTWYYTLKLVVCPKSFDKKKLESVMDFCGVDEDEVTIDDVISYGCDVNLGTETTEGEEFDYNVVTDIANVFETINALRGFYLDRNWSPFFNGWDIIRDCVEGVDMFKKIGEK